MVWSWRNGKICGKEMNAARKRLRRLGRATGARTHSAASDCIVRTVSFRPDSLKAISMGSDHMENRRNPLWNSTRFLYSGIL